MSKPPEKTFNYKLIVQVLKDKKEEGKCFLIHDMIVDPIYQLRKEFYDKRNGRESCRTSVHRCLSEMSNLPKSQIGCRDNPRGGREYFLKEVLRLV